MNRKSSLLLLPFLLFAPLAEADLIPYVVQRVEAIPGSGFVKLVGPARIEVKGETMPYKEATYISIRNISSISGVLGVEKVGQLFTTTRKVRRKESVSSNRPCK